jgi:hypothetical protein
MTIFRTHIPIIICNFAPQFENLINVHYCYEEKCHFDCT